MNGSTTFQKYWRLKVDRPTGMPELFDLRVKPKIQAGDDAANDVCLDTTQIPFQFPLLQLKKKGPHLRLTNEIHDSLQGEFTAVKVWKSKLYEGREYVVTGSAQWKIGNTQFSLQQVETIPVEVLATESNPEERKDWARSIGYTFALYLLLCLLAVSYQLVSSFFTPAQEELAVQKITVAEVDKVLNKLPEPTPAPIPEEVPAEQKPSVQEQKSEESVKPAESAPPVKMEKKQRQMKAATAPKVAGGKSAGTKAPDVRTMGLLAIQTAPGKSRVSVNVAAPQVVTSKPKASDTLALGLGTATAGVGVGEEEGVRVASLGSLSGETYKGGLGKKLKAARSPSITLARKEVEVRGALDPAVIRQIIEERLSEIRYCYENALLKNTALSGKVAAAWTITSEGSVQDIKSSSEEINQQTLHPCIRSQIQNWKFPKPKGGGVVHVRYPFVFNPVGGTN